MIIDDDDDDEHDDDDDHDEHDEHDELLYYIHHGFITHASSM
jgi:hypothetical protein